MTRVRFDPHRVTQVLLEERLPALEQLRQAVRPYLNAHDRVDPLALEQANPFIREVLRRTLGRGNEDRAAQNRPRTAAMKPMQLFGATVASLLLECRDASGAIDLEKLRGRFGDAAADIAEQASLAGKRVPDDPWLSRQSDSLVRDLFALDPKLVEVLAEAQGTPRRLPLLDERVKALGGERPLAGYRALCVQHVLGNTMPLFDALERAGILASEISVVGRGYSDNVVARAFGSARGYRMYETPELPLGQYEGAMRRHLRQVLTQAIREAEASGRPILLIDDGGMAVKLVNTEFRRYAHLFRCVEQTSRGITEIKSVAGGLATPVVNVARAEAKMREAPFVAEAVSRSLLRDLELCGFGALDGRRVTVFGYGVIGEQVARKLAERGAIVTVIEPDAAKLARAAERFTAHATPEGLEAAELVVGCSGYRSLGPAELSRMRDGVFVASCSSAEIEVDTQYLAGSAAGHVLPARGGSGSNHLNLQFRVDGRRINLLNQGRPINFDGQINSLAPADVQLTLGLLFEAALQSVASDRHELLDIPAGVQAALVTAVEQQTREDRPGGAHRIVPAATLPPLGLGLTPDALGTTPFWDVLKRLRACPEALLRGGGEALVKPYPGLPHGVWMADNLRTAFALPELPGRIVDFEQLGPYLRVTTIDEGKRHVHLLESRLELEPPAGEWHAVCEARQVLSLPESAVLGMSDPLPRLGRDGVRMTPHLYFLADGALHGYDLRNRGTHAIDGLPGLDSSSTEFFASPAGIFDRKGGKVYLLTWDGRAVRAVLDTGKLGERVRVAPNGDSWIFTWETKRPRRAVMALVDPIELSFCGGAHVDLPAGRQLHSIHTEVHRRPGSPFISSTETFFQLADAAHPNHEVERAPLTLDGRHWSMDDIGNSLSRLSREPYVERGDFVGGRNVAHVSRSSLAKK
jgi:S-adenosylhomocysteine hydrolase